LTTSRKENTTKAADFTGSYQGQRPSDGFAQVYNGLHRSHHFTIIKVTLLSSMGCFRERIRA